jgi:hypothetical protein
MGEAGYDMAFVGKVMNGYVKAAKRWVHPAFSSSDLWAVMTGSEEVEKFEVNGDLLKPGIAPTTYFANQAAKFIKGHARGKRPWFCYVPLHDPHGPYLPLKEHAYDGATYSSPATQEVNLSDKSEWALSQPKGRPEEFQRAYEGTMEELVTVDALHQGHSRRRSLLYPGSRCAVLRSGSDPRRLHR